MSSPATIRQEPAPRVSSLRLLRRLDGRARYVVGPALLIAALWFRVAVAVPPLNEVTVGTLWVYDYRAAVNAAAGFGFVHSAPSRP